MPQMTIKERVYRIIFDLLDSHPEGIGWTELNRMILKVDPGLHPKTVNGYVWKLVENYPDKVYKPQKGLFRLTKYR